MTIILTPDPDHHFEGRDGSPTDAIVVRETWVENVYQLADSDLEGGTVVDIGANIGAVSIYAAARGARVIAVEPEPSNADMLRRNIALNGYDGQILCHQLAVTDRAGHAFIAPNHGGSRLTSGSGWEVETVTLDQLFVLAAVDDCSVLKIDVEGAEYDIIAGASMDTLARVRFLTLEFDAAPDDRFGALVAKVAKLFNTHLIGSPERGGYLYGRRY